MDNEVTAANPADAPAVTPVNDDIVDLDAPQEAQTPAEGGDQTTDPDSIEALTKEALGSEEIASPDELVEVEYEGQKYKVPAPLKEGVLRQSDYTRKTMDLAEQRKAFETERDALKQTATRTQEEFAAHVQLAQLQDHVRQLEQMDITGMSQEQINAARLDLQDATRRRDGLVSALQRHEAQKAHTQSDQIAKLREECLANVAKEIPNFNDARRTELDTLAVKVGASPDEVASITEPYAYKLLHYADIGLKFIERQRKAAMMKAAQAGNPATKVEGAGGGSKPPEEMSMEEYIAARSSGKI